MKTAILTRAVLLSLAGTAALGSGCDNQHLLGGVDAGPPASDDSGTPPTVDAGVDVPDTGSPGPTQSWTGYIENYHFASGSDAIRISFAPDSSGNVVGTVTLGTGTPPPPATDPNVGYPADLLKASPDITIASRSYIAEGFGYSMRAGTLTAGRLRFGVDTSELWNGWCALQTPVPPQGMCDEPVCKSLCMPNWASMTGPNGCGLLNPATDLYEPVDCGKLALCGAWGVCICEASGCYVQDGGIKFMFDFALPSDLGSGSVVGQFGDHNVHLTKDP